MMKFRKASVPVMGGAFTSTGGSRLKASLKAVVALGVVGLSLAGCVVYPDNGYGYGYGGGYGGGYYPAPAYYAPPVALNFGYGWGGGWGRGGGRWR